MDDSLIHDRDVKVSDMVNEVGDWDLRNIEGILSDENIDLIMGKHPPMEELKDRIRWGLEASGSFSVKSCYKSFMGSRLGEVDSRWDWKGLERVKFFMWLVMHDRLCKNNRRASWCGCNPNCGLCVDSVETSLHVIRDCDIAKKLWLEFLPENYKDVFFAMNLEDWIILNLKRNETIGRMPWSVLFGVTCWLLWKWRNKRIFVSDWSYPTNCVAVICN